MSFLLTRETLWFLSINVGISALLRIGQYFSPELFFTIPVFLTAIGTMLVLNIYRAFTARPTRWIYTTIAILNLLTTASIGNSGFLTSINTIYLIISSLI